MVLEYVPPEEVTNPPAYIMVEETKKDIDPSIKIKSSDMPTHEDYQKILSSLNDVFTDGFQWQDIAVIMKFSSNYLKDYFSLDAQKKKEAVLAIIDYIIDNTDTPYLPDFITDPIFKILASSFVDIVIPEPDTENKYFAETKDEISPENVSEFIDEIKQEFSDGLEIKDIATITQKTISFVQQFIYADTDEKKLLAKEIVAEFIETLSIPLLPNHFSHTILIYLANGFIDNVVGIVEGG
ncbi:MAG: hypothetical protein KR126chlam6_00526 [Candidatus Anoxychlamydiales bacterium]|nr:hypothetical protein [Candidatus Anoxychlamydiales bacterium]